MFTEIDSRVKALKGKEVIDLGVGDTTLPMPKSIAKAYSKAALGMCKKRGFKGYGPECGYGFFIDAVKNRFSLLGVNLSEEEIFINDGAKTDMFTLLTLFKDASILIQDPIYPAYKDANTIFANTISYISANKSNSFLPMPCDIDKDLYNKSSLIYICSPSNPTGAVYSKEMLKNWIDYAEKSGSLIVFDSAYEGFVRGDNIKSIFQIKGAESVAIEICSLSKSASFTGVRCGYTVISKNLRVGENSVNKLFKRLKCTSTNGVSYVTQVAGMVALTKKGQAACRKNTDYYLRNANLFKDFFDKRGVFAVGGKNSPYVFFECPKGFTSKSFFDTLLCNDAIVLVPGSGFGSLGEGFMRIAGFSTFEKSKEAVKRLEKYY